MENKLKKKKFSLFSDNILNCLQGFSKPICGACSDEVAILPNGDILPCGGFVGCQNEKEIQIGNISSKINQEKQQFYLVNKDISSYNENCKKCIFLERCHHTCFANNNRVSNDRRIIMDCYCELSKIMIIESDKVLNKLLITKNPCFYRLYKDLLCNYNI